MKKVLIFKSDRFKKNRGGYSRWLLLSCEKCKTRLMMYQKDGPGMLKRLYVDRMVADRMITGKELVCAKCGTVLGVRIMYQKENRPAFRLFAGAIGKKLIKGTRPGH